MNPRDIAGNAEEEEWWTPEIWLGTQKKKKSGEPQRYSWERRRRRVVNPGELHVCDQRHERKVFFFFCSFFFCFFFTSPDRPLAVTTLVRFSSM